MYTVGCALCHDRLKTCVTGVIHTAHCFLDSLFGAVSLGSTGPSLPEGCLTLWVKTPSSFPGFEWAGYEEVIGYRAGSLIASYLTG